MGKPGRASGTTTHTKSDADISKTFKDGADSLKKDSNTITPQMKTQAEQGDTRPIEQAVQPVVDKVAKVNEGMTEGMDSTEKKEVFTDCSNIDPNSPDNLKTDTVKGFWAKTKAWIDKKTTLTPEQKDNVWKGFKVCGIVGLGLGSIIGLLHLIAAERSGCYIIKAKGGSVKSCKQASCSIGSTCGTSEGKPLASGKCCESGEKADKNDTCKCVEVSPWDVAGGLANSLATGFEGIASALGTGADLFAKLMDALPMLGVGIVGFGVFYLLKNYVFNDSPKQSSSPQIQTYIQPPPPKQAYKAPSI